MSTWAVGPQQKQDLRWWRRTGDEVHQTIASCLAILRQRQKLRMNAYLYFARAYAGPQIDGLSMQRYATSQVAFRSNTLAFNVIASVCNTVAAKIAKNRPLPKFVTNGGDWTQQRKAKLLSKFIEGEFDRSRVWETMPLLALDACVWGEGVAKVYQDGDCIHVEREFPWRVIADDAEAQYGWGNVRSCYQRKPIDRLVLAEMFPEAKDWILNDAKNDEDEDEWGLESTSDQLIVTEAWHLRSGKKANDGKHAIIVYGKTLFEEDYERDYFPFVWLRRSQPQMGVHAIGDAEALSGLQYEINFTAKKIQESHYRMGGSHWFVENNSKVKAEQLTNGIATIIRYTGSPPQPLAPQPVNQATMDYLLTLIPKAYEMRGVSQMAAQAKKPAGLDSGVAIREWNDTESEGFVVFAKLYENACVEIARQMVDLLRELVAVNPDYAANIRGRRFLKRVKFADVSLEPDAFIVECFPTSMLPHTPAGRLEQIQTLVQSGLISDPKEARRLLAFPDLEASNNLANSAHDLVEETLERILDDGLYSPPEPFMDLVDALYTAQQTYLQARVDGCPEELLELLRQWIDEAKTLLDAGKPAPPPAPAGAPGMPPPGAPMPPPDAGAPPPPPQGLAA